MALRKPTGEEIDAALDGLGEFAKGVQYWTWTGSQRMFADIMRTRPMGRSERIGRLSGGVLLELLDNLGSTRKPR